MSFYQKIKNNEAGYLLLELIIVSVIIAIISVATIPSVTGLKSRGDLDRATQNMLAEFSFVQQTAVASGKTCRIEFFSQIEAFRLRLPGETRIVRLPKGIRISSNNFPGYDGGNYRLLSFNRNGAPNQAGTVSLANEKGDRLYIIVYLATGRMRISESPPENW